MLATPIKSWLTALYWETTNDRVHVISQPVLNHASTPRRSSLQLTRAMDRLLHGLLALSVLLACNRAAVVAEAAVAVNVTSTDLVQEISDTLCAVDIPTLFSHIFRFCAQDGVPKLKCGKYV